MKVNLSHRHVQIATNLLFCFAYSDGDMHVYVCIHDVKCPDTVDVYIAGTMYKYLKVHIFTICTAISDSVFSTLYTYIIT